MHNKNKKISTKNLYFCEVSQITNIKLNYFADYGKFTYSFSEQRRHTLCRKGMLGYYNVFDKKLYKEYIHCKENDLSVIGVEPCIDDRKYITYDEAIELLWEYSPHMGVIKENNVKKRKLVKEK